MSDHTIDLDAALRTIIAHGPSRVVIDGNATATSPKRALQKGISYDVVFIRNDGWTLGAPDTLARCAYLTWPDQWIGVAVEGEVVSIAAWLGGQMRDGAA